MRKIPTRLRGTNFCTSSARFAPSFIRQPNGPECTQMVRNAPKYQFRVQWGGSGAFVAKNSYATNGPECTQTVQNAPKHHLRVQWGGSGAFLAENSDATSCTNFCTISTRFAPSFVSQPNGPECTQIVRNASKPQFRVQWGGSGAFVAKNSDATSWHELLH